METGDAEGLSGALGTGAGKWRLMVTSDQSIQVMNLLSSPAGHLTNLSTVPDNAQPDEGGATFTHGVPLFLSARSFTGEGRQSFVRIINHAGEGGSVRIDAFDDDGMQYGPLTLEIGAGETVHFNSDDLEQGNADKGLTGATGSGEGSWRLALTSTLDIEVLSYLRTHDGFVTSMHDLVPYTESVYRLAIFNRGSNTRVSQLRLVNPGTETAEVTIEGVDDAGESPGGAVRLSVPGGGARTAHIPGVGDRGRRGPERCARHRGRQVAVGGALGPVDSGDEPAVESGRSSDQSVHRAGRGGPGHGLLGTGDRPCRRLRGGGGAAERPGHAPHNDSGLERLVCLPRPRAR